MIFFWSDTHFFHRGIIGYAKRPDVRVGEDGEFEPDVEAMNERLVALWAEEVRRSDTIYLVGDFAFGGRVPMRALFDRLPGHKHLIIGNHDERNPAVLALPWETQSDLLTVRDNGRRIIACHYPLETWKGAQKGYVHVHGHSHGSLKRVIPHRFDVGCDVEPRPVSFDEIWSRAEAQPFVAQDHHGD